MTAGVLGMLVLFGSALVAGGWEDAPDLVQIPAFVVMTVGFCVGYFLDWRQRRRQRPPETR